MAERERCADSSMYIFGNQQMKRAMIGGRKIEYAEAKTLLKRQSNYKEIKQIRRKLRHQGKVKKMKRYFLLLCAFFTVLVMLAGCEDIEEITDNGEIFVDKEWEIYPREHLLTKPVEIEFWSANSAVDLHGVVQADLVDRFNAYQKETYPDSYIKVNISFQGGYITQNTKLQAALIGKTNPEIAMVGVSSLALYLDNTVDMRKSSLMMRSAIFTKVFSSLPCTGIN